MYRMHEGAGGCEGPNGHLGCRPLNNENPALAKKALRMVIPLTVSYLYESGFPTMAVIKTKYQPRTYLEREMGGGSFVKIRDKEIVLWRNKDILLDVELFHARTWAFAVP